MRALCDTMNRAVDRVLQDPANPYNFGLRFNKWAPFARDGEGVKPEAVRAFNQWAGRQRDPLMRALERQTAYARSAASRKELAIQVEASVVTPLVLGIGGAHPSEVGLTLHWTLGVPYLPAPSLKGLCRFGFEVEEINQFQSETELREQERSLMSVWTGKPMLDDRKEPRQERLVSDNLTNPDWPPTVEHFGSQEAMGTVRFLDGLPLPDGLALQLDIMNPHYPEYYRNHGASGPTECQNPTPILFWTVSPRSRFRLTLLVQERHRSQLERAAACLKTGLQSYGIGAKTAVGYGRLQCVEGSEARYGDPYDRDRAERERVAQLEAEQKAREARALGLQRELESDTSIIQKFKGAQDKSTLEAILQKYEARDLSPAERRQVREKLESALSKDLRKGKLGEVLTRWQASSG